MFKPERMQIVAVMIPEPQTELVTAAIARAGLVHLVDAVKLPAPYQAKPRERGRSLLERAAADLEKAQGLARRLGVGPAQRPKLSLSLGAEGFLGQVEGRLAELESELNAIEEQLARAQSEESKLEEISCLLELAEVGPVTIEELRGGLFDRVFLGFVSAEDLPRLETKLKRAPCAFSTGWAARARRAVCVVTSDRHEDELKQLLAEVGFVAAALPEGLSGLVSAAREQVEEQLWVAREEQAELRAKLQELRRQRGGELSQYLIELAALRRIEEASLKFGCTGSTEIIAGWVPERMVGLLSRIVQDVTGGKALVAPIEEAGSHEFPPPTSLRNPPLIRAFESLVGLYGTPPYDGVDPTPFVAFSFTLMFGVMFGDVGHGAVLAAAGFAAWLFFRPFSRGGRDLGEMLMFCGISAVFFGLLFGSVFGNEHLIPALLFHPLEKENINSTLGLGIAVGVFMLSAGIILNVAQQMMRKRWKDALIGEWGLASLFFYWSLIGTLAYAILSPDVSVATLATVLALAAGLPLVLTAFRGPLGNLVYKLRSLRRSDAVAHEEEEEEDSLSAAIGALIMALETITGTFSHIRVAAFALNHAALCSAVFLIAKVLKDAGASSGIAASVIVLGNAIVILLEGMIVFIQGMRLHFYEFFSKFFVKMGMPYTPFQID